MHTPSRSFPPRRLAVVAALCLHAAGCAAPGRTKSSAQLATAGSPRAAVDELLAADRAFAAASARTDVVSGLAAMLAPDVVVPAPGKGFFDGAAQVAEALRADTLNARSRAEWVPIRGGIAADGAHGFTFGYMTVYRPDSSRVPFKYLAYWVKRPEGWRVVVYKRGRRAPGDVSLDPMPPALPPRMVSPSDDAARVERVRAELDSTERAFSDRAQVVGLGPAFTEYGSADAVNMGGPGAAAFVVGSEAIGRVVSAGGPPTGSPVSWAPDHRVIVASSGDLGVTIGMIRPNGPPPTAGAGAPAPAGFPFFTTWRRAGPGDPWRYIAE